MNVTQNTRIRLLKQHFLLCFNPAELFLEAVEDGLVRRVQHGGVEGEAGPPRNQARAKVSGQLTLQPLANVLQPLQN